MSSAHKSYVELCTYAHICIYVYTHAYNYKHIYVYESLSLSIYICIGIYIAHIPYQGEIILDPVECRETVGFPKSLLWPVRPMTFLWHAFGSRLVRQIDRVLLMRTYLDLLQSGFSFIAGYTLCSIR